MIKYFCDRCGDEIGNYNINEIFEVTVKSPAAIRPWGDDVKTGSYMFCYDCVRELNKFIEQEEKE